jgi:predicted RNA binding protein YcfA (HicA-like mRNA interferase family)
MTRFGCVWKHMDSRIIIAAIEADGWREVRVTGSHHHFKHPTRPGTVTVPHPKRDVPIGTLRSIERVAGVRLR